MTGRRIAGRRSPGHVSIVAVAVAAAAALAATTPGVTWAAAAAPGGAGTDTSLPLTSSKHTVSGRDRFARLEITVNQTKNLANQAISVTWSGGEPTTDFGGGTGTIGEHFLQMFQCWGDDDGSNPENPGPPPEQCQQGATAGVFGGDSATGRLFQGSTLTRVISSRGAPNFDPTLGTLDEFGSVSLPFRAVDGTVVPQWRDTAFNPQVGGGSYWLNPYFNIITTNEIAGARTAADGRGADLFEATTGLESTGLGCGQSVQEQADGSTKVPRCWLVVVPRGGAADENEGANVGPLFGVSTSPLAPASWKNRIAIPLEFNPVDSSCPLSAEQRRVVGSELLSAAVSSWQPALCATPGLSPYAYGSISDSRARQQLVGGGPGAPGMAVVSRPLEPASLDPQNPVVYAPLTLSGTVIGFNIERLPRVIFPTGEQPPEEVLAAERQLTGVRVAALNLTPRLVAKLLSQSYRSQVEINASKPPYPWSTANPPHIDEDPDFLQFNPEFELLRTSTKNMGGLVVAGPSSDAAAQVWEWVLADPEAQEWLAGIADPWGMNVNPFYSTSPTLNPQGAPFGEPLPDSYPKNDPYCYQAPEVGPLKVVPPPLCGLDWLPYTQGFRDAARATRAANDGARTTTDGSAGSAGSADKVYRSDGPQGLGQRAILSITDTASAAQYGLQTARLSRAGDNTAGRAFVAADQAGLAAGAVALREKAVPRFLEPSPADAPAGAYPLAALTYAAVSPASLDAKARKEYAAFVDYAAGPGQVPGFEYGQLPAGYSPLSQDLRAQAKAAAALIAASPAGEAQPTATDPASGANPSSGGTGTAQAGATAEPAGPGSTASATAPPQLPPTTPPVVARTAVERIVDAVVTPFHDLAATRFALPVLVVVALLSALAALEITKLRSRRGPKRGSGPAPGDAGSA